MKPFILSYLE